MSYYRELAFELRTRKCTERQVTEVLETVRESVAAGNPNVESEFGSPKDYAAQYQGSRKSSPGQRTLTVFALLGLAQLVLQRLLLDLEFFPWGVVAGFGGFVVFLAIGIIVASMVDHGLPRGFTVPDRV